MSKKVAFIAHCLLNQNAKVEGGAKRPGMWEPVIDLLRERGYVIRQMPCPELAFGGARRFWGVREQFDTQLYREHCRRLAKLVAAVMEQHTTAGDDVVLIGVDSSPTMGVDFTPSAPHWAGQPNIVEDDSALGAWLEQVAEHVTEFRRNDYEVVVASDGLYATEIAALALPQYAIQPPSTSRLTPET